MAAVRGGDIRQLTIQGREFEVKGGDANVSIDLGGFANEIDFAGNGVVMTRQRRKAAGFGDCPIMVDDSREDFEYLKGLADAGDPVPVNMTLASGVTYSGNLTIVGDLAKATGDGTLTLEMRGAKFEQI